MARYFFNVSNCEFVPDASGTGCASAIEVKDQAVKAAGQSLRDQGLDIWKTGSWYMFVCDEKNRTILKLEFTSEDLTGEMS